MVRGAVSSEIRMSQSLDEPDYNVSNRAWIARDCDIGGRDPPYSRNMYEQNWTLTSRLLHTAYIKYKAKQLRSIVVEMFLSLKTILH